MSHKSIFTHIERQMYAIYYIRHRAGIWVRWKIQLLLQKIGIGRAYADIRYMNSLRHSRPAGSDMQRFNKFVLSVGILLYLYLFVLACALLTPRPAILDKETAALLFAFVPFILTIVICYIFGPIEEQAARYEQLYFRHSLIYKNQYIKNAEYIIVFSIVFFIGLYSIL